MRKSSTAEITHEGTVAIKVIVKGQARRLVIKNVLYAQTGICNLLSESYLNEHKNMRCEALPPSMTNCGRTVWYGYQGKCKKPFIEARVIDGLREVLLQDSATFTKLCAVEVSATPVSSSPFSVHKRMGHPSVSTMKRMQTAVEGCDYELTSNHVKKVTECV